MPSTKKPKRETKEDADEIEENKHAANKKITYFDKGESTQWIFLMNEEIVTYDPSQENKPVICALKHPKTDRQAQFLFANGDQKVYEISQFKEEFRSWLIDQTVHHDGSLFITTAFDPLFLMLPYMIHSSKMKHFMTLDHILVDEVYPECRRLKHACSPEEMLYIADMKGNDDLKAYRYNKDKTMSWLKLKAEKVAELLQRKKVNVAGAKCSDLIQNTASQEEYMRFAFGIVSEYLPADVTASLREHLGIPIIAEKRPVDEKNPPLKRVKLEDITPLEDYSQNSRQDSKTKGKAATLAQKKLDKVDKTGMKTMMSFFTPKAKS